MGKPSHFRLKDPKKCCSKCRYKKLDTKSYVRRCVLHNFELPEDLNSLDNHTCDDFEAVEEGDN